MTLLLAIAHPPIKHPPEINLPPEAASRIYAAIDADHMKPTAIEIATVDLFDITQPVVLVYGDLKKSSASVCRGSVVTYEQNESTQAWQRVPVAAYVVVPATNCQAPPKTASRIIIDGKASVTDVTGIVAAIRAGRTSEKLDLPAFTQRAAINAIKVQKDQEVASISSPQGEQKSLLTVRTGKQWSIAAAGNDIALPNPQ
ncbi:MAG: hypothetical protein M3041_17830 [Acidobacteriota bacterium]|nr:hypothetical protein [Acidobacteriota bacterium]